MTRRVCIFSGSRAELGLQLPIWQAIQAHPDLEPLMLIGGTHTQQGVHPDDLRDVPIAGKVYELPNEGHQGTPQAIATGILSTSEVLADLRPDFMVVYGDRFESYAACIASTQMGIPTAHVEGGDYTAGGCLDDAVRHAMTKLAHLHFTTNEQATERITRMGEEPWRIRTVGLPSLDFAAAGDYASEAELAAEFGLDLSRPVVLFCLHPVPGTDPTAESHAALAALGMLAIDGCQVIALHPNNDKGGREMLASLKRDIVDMPDAQLHANLGRRKFHGMLAMLGEGHGALVGNSSAGIKEAPFFGCPVVNVGTRQEGRLRAGWIMEAECKPHAIYRDARRAITHAFEVWRSDVYGNGTAGKRIAEVLATVEMGAKLVQKRMTY